VLDSDTLINGLTRGAIYALIALGYTMVYGILGMINFAHGEVYMIGMFAGIITLAVANTTGLGAMSVPFALFLAFLFAMFMSSDVGFTNERVAYRPLRRAHVLAPLITAIGLSTLLQNFIMNAQSKDKVDFPQKYSAYFTDHWVMFGSSRVSYLQIFIVVLSVALMAALQYFVARTKFGKAMRACSQDKTMAELVGIPLDRVISVTFIVGSALAAAAGMLFAMYNGLARFDSGYVAGIRAFTAAVLGGIGNIPGAVLGGLIIGLAEAWTASRPWGSDWQQVVAFVVLMLVLIIRPRGLLGERVAEKL
jgi:branched-chain amino acid transport system permease protein